MKIYLKLWFCGMVHCVPAALCELLFAKSQINYSQQELGKLRSSQCWVMLGCEQLWTREKRAERREIREERRDEEQRREVVALVCFGRTPLALSELCFWRVSVCWSVRRWYMVHGTLHIVHAAWYMVHVPQPTRYKCSICDVSMWVGKHVVSAWLA